MKSEVPRDEFIRKRMERQRRIRKRRLTIFFCFLIIVLLCVAATLSLTVFFPIENLSASGSAVYTSEQILKASEVEKGDNLFATSRSQTEERLKEKLPYIDSVRLERVLPGTLKITVTDAEEYACLCVDGRYYTVSQSGWVLKENSQIPENLFCVFGLKAECEVGSAVAVASDGASALVERIVTALKQSKLNINFVDITDNVTLSLKVEGRFEVNLGTANNIEEKIKHLAAMIESIDPEKSGSINLSMWTSNNTKGTFVEKHTE